MKYAYVPRLEDFGFEFRPLVSPLMTGNSVEVRRHQVDALNRK